MLDYKAGPGAPPGMKNDLESGTSAKVERGYTTSAGWMKIGLVAVASVALGGMATAWWYRKTLIRLRQAEEHAPNPQFGISEADPPDEV
jgi:hypothetical protein